MTSDRYHRAARDGYLDLLREASRRDANTPDEDGMTPTLWASYEGRLDALRLLVGRGGDPDKCDHYGNTGLHCSAARGHMNCVSFLVNFGVNLWALDNDFHTPKDLAAMNNREDVLRYLDGVIAKQEALNKKVAKGLKEKAVKDAEKRIKDFSKIQKKAEKKAAKDEKKMVKERKRMEKSNEPTTVSKATTNMLTLRMDTKVIHAATPKFSELTNTMTSATSRRVATGVNRKVQQQKKKLHDENRNEGEFKVGGVEEDGKRSVRSLSGLRRDSQIMYVQKYDDDIVSSGKRGKISDVFDGSLVRSSSQPDFLHPEFNDDSLINEPSSIFDRPGFGSVAFRTSMNAALSSIPGRSDDLDSAHASDRGSGGSGPRSARDDSIGSAGSLAQRNTNLPWDDEDFPSDEEAETSPVQLFLASAGLTDYIPKFMKEQVDLEALLLLTEDDLKAMGLPLGPRKKLIKAVSERQHTMSEPGRVTDSRL